MIRIFLCDDNSLFLKEIEQAIKNIFRNGKMEGIEVETDTFLSGESLLDGVESAIKKDSGIPDIIFLDILMGKMNGIDTARLLQKKGCQAQIVFLTSSKEYVFESFEVHPFHYLLKSAINTEILEKVLKENYLNMTKESEEYFCIKNSERVFRTPYKKIIYIEVMGHNLNIHEESALEPVVMYDSLTKYIKELEDHGFVRIHKSYAVSMRYIKELSPASVILINEEELPIGRVYKKRVKEQYIRYLEH